MTSVAALQSLAHTGAHVFDFTKMQGDHHGPAIDAMFQDVLGDQYIPEYDNPALWGDRLQLAIDRPILGNRVALKPVVVPVGGIYMPHGQALVAQTIQEFKMYGVGFTSYQVNERPQDSRFSGSAVVIRGRPAYQSGVVYDGIRNGRFLDISIRVLPDNRSDPNTGCIEGMMLCKTNAHHTSTPLHDVEVDTEVTGWWSGPAVRLGSRWWNGSQEDHLIATVRALGQYDSLSEDQTMWWQGGASVGNSNWGNNRRQRIKWLKAIGVRTPLSVEKSAVQVDWLTCDSFRTMVQVHGTVGKVVINGGECENGQFLFSDTLGFGHDHGLTIRDFYAKLNAWRPGLGSAWHGPGDPRPDLNEIANWWSRGQVNLDNVSISGLPVRRNPATGKLVVVENVHTVEEAGEQKERWDWTEKEPPRIRMMSASRLNATGGTGIHGYDGHPSQAIQCREGAEARLKGWRAARPDGMWKHTYVDIKLDARSAA